MKIMLKCSHCPKEFKYESEKKRHEQSHIPQFECNDCLKKFSFLSALRRHQKQHKRTGTVQCTECSRNFRDNTLLLRHIKYAHKGTHVCPKCNAKFNSGLALSCHLKTHKPKSERVFKCSYCDKTFNFMHHLKHHEQTHSKRKEYYCNTCGRGFIQAHHLKTHLKTHEPQTWLHCSFNNCKKTFPTEYALKRHLATHDTVLCSSCGKMVSLSSNNKHITNCVPYKESHMQSDLSQAKSIFENENYVPNLIRDDIVEGQWDAKTNLKTASVKTLDVYCESSLLNNNNFLLKNLEYSALQPTNAISVKATKCEGCSCNVNKNCNLENNSLKPMLQNISGGDDFPNIEYNIDGSVKLIDTFDFEFEVESKAALTKEETPRLENNSIKKNSVPFNSCKDILGKCIVSGNGTISEECLCAKMSMDNQEIIAQEIDEITPNPVGTSKLRLCDRYL